MAESVPGERRNVLILALAQALFLTATVTVMTLSGVVGRDLAPTPGLATLPVAAMMVGAVVATFPASMLMKRLGRRAGFLMGTLGGGLAGAALAALSVELQTFWGFTAGNFLIGVYQGFAMYYRFAAADAAGPAFRSKAISLVMAGGVVAAFLGPWNADHGQAIPVLTPEAGPYLILAVAALVATALVAGLRMPRAAEPSGVAQRRLAEIARQPAFPVAMLAGAAGYAVMTLVMTATPLAIRDAGFGMESAAMVMQAHVLGMFLPSFVTGHLIQRFGMTTILLAGAALMLAASGTAMAGVSLAHFLVALILLGVGWNFLFVGGSALLTTTHSVEERGKVQGLNDLAVFGLVAVGSLASGAFLHTVGWVGLNLAASLPIFVVAGAVIWLKLGVRRAAGGETA